MIIRKTIAGVAAAGLIFGSTAAAAAPAPAERGGSNVSSSEEFAGTGTFTLLLGLLILAGIIGVIASNDNDDLPTSP
ncbi:hypothetical protein GRI89_09025 [Altererythrobacter salegens]|uniref:Ferrochelatase n=1 Tax=Croceibacterium salegens TaxID=1737568 RepID=A0A6I4SUU5_9SPHN|nr:hypothetical protein [Croceibacterium salegens]MXO59681.1 hypothetical protein [Croceibacterium salegens]